MTCRRAIGDTLPWGGPAASEDVYVWRAPLADGVVLTEAEDAQLILRAAARALERFDTRGITVYTCGPADLQCVDVVFTADGFVPYALAELTRRAVHETVEHDADLLRRYPQLRLGPSSFLKLTAPAAAVDAWLAHAIVWDDTLGPTASFAKLEGVYKGTAADQLPLRPWLHATPNGSTPKPPGGQPLPGWIGPAAAFVATAGAVWLGAHYFAGGAGP